MSHDLQNAALPPAATTQTSSPSASGIVVAAILGDDLERLRKQSETFLDSERQQTLAAQQEMARFD